MKSWKRHNVNLDYDVCCFPPYEKWVAIYIYRNLEKGVDQGGDY